MSALRVGFSGHQSLSPKTVGLVRAFLRAEVAALGEVTGLCSLAAGSDQLFAQVLLDTGNELEVLVPSADYESTFSEPETLATYQKLKSRASSIIVLGASAPTEEAFYNAGRKVIERSAVLIAVWDGKPAAGLGGTADVVAYARSLGREVKIVWPEGSRR